MVSKVLLGGYYVVAPKWFVKKIFFLKNVNGVWLCKNHYYNISVFWVIAGRPFHYLVSVTVFHSSESQTVIDWITVTPEAVWTSKTPNTVAFDITTEYRIKTTDSIREWTSQTWNCEGKTGYSWSLEVKKKINKKSVKEESQLCRIWVCGENTVQLDDSVTLLNSSQHTNMITAVPAGYFNSQ